MAAAGHQRKLIVEVVDARDLSPKDGHGTSSPYVVVDYYGQRKRTRTTVRDLNPTWNEALEFNVGPPSSVFGDVLELDVYHDRNHGPTRRSNFLGRIRLSSTQFVKKGEEALIYFHLEKKSLFSWIQGEIGLRIYYVDQEVAPTNETPVVDGNIITQAVENPLVDGTRAPTPENPVIDGTTTQAVENPLVDGIRAPTPENPVIDGTTTQAVENPLVDGIRAPTPENPVIDGTTTQAVENPLVDGIIASVAENPPVDGTVASAAENPLVDGIAVPTTKNHFVDGTSASAAENPLVDGTPTLVAENTIVDGIADPAAENLPVDGTTAQTVENSIVYGTTTQIVGNLPIDGNAAPAAENQAVNGTTVPTTETSTIKSTTSKENATLVDEMSPLDAHPSREVEKQTEMSPEKLLENNQTQTTPSSKSKLEQDINFAPKSIRKLAPTSSYTLESAENQTIKQSTFDLVEKMHYLFVRVVKARSLATTNRPIVQIEAFGKRIISKQARKSLLFEWDQTFAFSREPANSTSIMEISIWDVKDDVVLSLANTEKCNFLGGLCFEVSDILLRDPPDTPLAPQWYKLEQKRNDVAYNGYLMLATWIGTQADDTFDEALKTDAVGSFNSRAKIYQSPKLWYLRATVIEARDVVPITVVKEDSFQVRAQLGFQVSITRPIIMQNAALSWNEDLIFVTAEPMTDHLVFTLESRRSSKPPVAVGIVRIPLIEIERRVDNRIVTTRWCTLTGPKKENGSSYKGRIQVRLCFDGGYHVMDEATHVSSDYRPTARQLWNPPVGLIEIGVIGCKNLVPMKSTMARKGSTDAYCVAKYGSKWVRTRTVCNSYDPKWNEQYTWQVYDPCTVLTIGVFDSMEEPNIDDPNEPNRPDSRIGKVRIRISTLKTGKVYRNLYPLVVLSAAGTKKMGELEIAVRFVRTAPRMDFIHVYTQPLLPLMHHVKPIGVRQQDQLRGAAVETVVGHLSRSDPPLGREIVLFMLDAESHGFSMRKIRANWCRVINVAAAVIAAVKWIDDTRSWRNPTSTILVHALLVLLIWYPELIIPTISFYAFVTGAWNYKFRSSGLLAHYDLKLSMVDDVERDELDEEFDGVPSARSPEIVRMRYDKLRAIGARVQSLLGDLATQGERVQALVTWRDPRATGIFTAICFAVAVVLYVVPLRMVAVASGFYYLRHPVFRDRLPSPVLNFLTRLPSLSDRLM